MIIFTVTNKTTGQVYVGYTRNRVDEQWNKIVSAANNKTLDFPLYHEIRQLGASGFTVDEYDYAETRNEAREIEEEALSRFNAQSLRGYKTSTKIFISNTTTRRRKAKKEDKNLKNLFAVNPDNDPEIDDSLLLEEQPSDNNADNTSVDENSKPGEDKTSITIKTKPSAKDDVATGIQPSKPAYARVPDPIESSINPDNKTRPVKSGDVTSNLNPIAEIPAFSDNALTMESTNPAENKTPEVTLTPRQKRIKEAIARQRQHISQRTASDMENHKASLKNTINTLLEKARKITPKSH